MVAGLILARDSGSGQLRKEVLNTIATAIPAAVDAVQKRPCLSLLDRRPCAVSVGAPLRRDSGLQ